MTNPDIYPYVADEAKNLALFMNELLERTVNVYQSYSMPLPDRRYWTLGTPAVDCEQLVISFVQMYIGAPGDEATEPRRCRDPRSATVQISVSRKVPTVSQNQKAPKPEDIQEFSEICAYDAWVLLDSASSLDTWEVAGPGLGIIATVETGAPEGGFQTTTMTLTAGVP